MRPVSTQRDERVSLCLTHASCKARHGTVRHVVTAQRHGIAKTSEKINKNEFCFEHSVMGDGMNRVTEGGRGQREQLPDLGG